MVLSLRRYLPYDKRLRASVALRTRKRANGSWKEAAKRFKFVAGGGLPVAKAQMPMFLSDDEFGAVPEIKENGNVLTKATNNARGVKQPYEQFTLELFLYLALASRFAERLRRVTTDRVRAEAAEIAASQQQENSRFGSIAKHHLAVHIARLLDGTAVPAPNDNTMQQAMALDAAVRPLVRS
ncbi:hypothetical protein GN244_ATG15322 [Phytophthora infestans]|uniref:Uncharacterized protein n=1 Tax=Phytophthora infestans TaxID=4787 RepID=A0A833W8I5_PHYIN|nr:hypothetical protein GN244_ATG15322 [Phytophthora infestans]